LALVRLALLRLALGATRAQVGAGQVRIRAGILIENFSKRAAPGTDDGVAIEQRALEIHQGEVGSGEVRAAYVREFEVGIVQVRINQLCAVQIGIFEEREAEVLARQDGVGRALVFYLPDHLGWGSMAVLVSMIIPLNMAKSSSAPASTAELRLAPVQIRAYHARAAEIAEARVGAVQRRSVEDGVGGFNGKQVRVGEVRAGKIRIFQIGSGKNGVWQRRRSETRVDQTCPEKVRPGHVAGGEIDVVHLRVLQVDDRLHAVKGAARIGIHDTQGLVKRASDGAADGRPVLQVRTAQDLILRHERQIADRRKGLRLPTDERRGLIGERDGGAEGPLGLGINRQAEQSARDERQTKTGFDAQPVHCSIVGDAIIPRLFGAMVVSVMETVLPVPATLLAW